mmetsp:Transcript_34996/g.70791  ORF Transcript_34996/g.70791 Transcript_34996/m.70791 type:complete len:108 (-) Transcript_34996:7-330(-)
MSRRPRLKRRTVVGQTESSGQSTSKKAKDVQCQEHAEAMCQRTMNAETRALLQQQQQQAISRPSGHHQTVRPKTQARGHHQHTMTVRRYGVAPLAFEKRTEEMLLLE